MFGWRKRNDGFEWHKYVRTTIKLRRDARREKACRLRQQAADGVQAMGTAAGAAARDGVRHIGAGSIVAAHGLGVAMRKGLAQAFRTLTPAVGKLWMGARPTLDLLGRPGVGGPLALVGVIALGAGLVRLALGRGIDREGGIALAIGTVCLACAYAPGLLLGHGLGAPAPFAMLKSRSRIMAVGIAFVAASTAVLLLLGHGPIALPGLANLPALPFAAARSLSGRATVLAANQVRIGAVTVVLAGLEAPERDQRCTRNGNRRWRCGEAAMAALARLAANRQLTCEVGAADAAGVVIGSCFDGTVDINAELVRGGHVFADTGLISRYRSAEAEARAAKAGVWSGDADRPAEWRAKIWDEAKRRAPDGCPIKGRVAGRSKVYVLPWSPDYDRVRVSKVRGEQWFCSEQEAISAGWSMAGRG